MSSHEDYTTLHSPSNSSNTMQYCTRPQYNYQQYNKKYDEDESQNNFGKLLLSTDVVSNYESFENKLGHKSPTAVDSGTDYVKYFGKFRGRMSIKRLAYIITLCILIIAIVTVVYFLLPRKITIIHSPLIYSMSFTNDTSPQVSVNFDDQFLVSNPNYAAITIQNVLLNLRLIVNDSNSLFIGSSNLIVDRSFSSQTSNGDFALVNQHWNMSVTNNMYMKLYAEYKAQCDASKSFDIVSDGTAEVQVLSRHPTVYLNTIVVHGSCKNNDNNNSNND